MPMKLIKHHQYENADHARIQKVLSDWVNLVFCRCFLVDKGKKDPNTTKSGPVLAYQQKAIEMAFCLQADDGQTLNFDLVACDF